MSASAVTAGVAPSRAGWQHSARSRPEPQGHVDSAMPLIIATWRAPVPMRHRCPCDATRRRSEHRALLAWRRGARCPGPAPGRCMRPPGRPRRRWRHPHCGCRRGTRVRCRDFLEVQTAAGARHAGVALRGNDHGDCRAVIPRERRQVREAPVRHGEQHFAGVALQARQDGLRFRIAEAHVELDHTRSVRAQHQAGVQHAAVRDLATQEFVHQRTEYLALDHARAARRPPRGPGTAPPCRRCSDPRRRRARACGRGTARGRRMSPSETSGDDREFGADEAAPRSPRAHRPRRRRASPAWSAARLRPHARSAATTTPLPAAARRP